MLPRITLRSDQRGSFESSDGNPLRPERTAIDTRDALLG